MDQSSTVVLLGNTPQARPQNSNSAPSIIISTHSCSSRTGKCKVDPSLRLIHRPCAHFSSITLNVRQGKNCFVATEDAIITYRHPGGRLACVPSPLRRDFGRAQQMFMFGSCVRQITKHDLAVVFTSEFFSLFVAGSTTTRVARKNHCDISPAYQQVRFRTKRDTNSVVHIVFLVH